MKAHRIANLIGLSLASMAGGLSAAPAVATDCVPTSAQQMIAAGTSHFNALLHPEHSFEVPLADDARRTELPPTGPRESGGAVNGTSAAELRAFYGAFPTLRFIRGFGDFRWVVDVPNCEATIFLLIDFELPTLPLTLHLGERFRVSAGLIEEIETIQWRASGVDGSCWPAGTDPAEGRNGPCPRDMTSDPYGPVEGCVPGSRNQTVAAAQSYLDAMDSNDASGVPLSPDARRTEMPPPKAGPVTGISAAEIASSVEGDARFRQIEGIRDVRWFVDPSRCQATAFYLTDGPTGTVGTRHHATRFLVSGGLIREIEDIWRGPIDASRPEGSCWPRNPDRIQDESYRALPCPA